MKILNSLNFENGIFPSLEFEFPVEVIKIENEEYKGVQVKAVYDNEAKILLSLSAKTFVESSLKQHPEEIIFDGKCFPEPIELFATTWPFFKLLESPAVKMVAKKQPFLMDFGSNAQRIELILLNGSDLCARAGNSDFEWDGLSIRVTNLPSAEEHFKNKKSLKYDCIATHKVEITSKDKNYISSDKTLKALHDFSSFLMFVRGARVSFGNVVGYSPDDKIAFVHLGFLPKDPFTISDNSWFDSAYISGLNEVYRHFSKAFSMEADKAVIKRALEFYRASNVSRGLSLELAVIASCAAIETIVPHILSKRAGWSKSLLNNRATSFHDKIRAAATFVGIGTNIFDHLPELEKRAETLKNIDAYEILTVFRNRIVHQGKPFDYTGLELIEVWNLSQWLVEIFIFYFLGYRGEMIDRRKNSGWKGETVKVPLPVVNLST